jgi:hypothetical protein
VRHSKLAVVLVLGVAGCFNPDPPAAQEADVTGSSTGVAATGDVQTTSSDPSVGSSESGPGACEVCVPTAPEGWQGPLVLGAGKNAPSCAAPYTAVVFQVAEDISGEDASCGCECGDPEVDCDALLVQYAPGACGQNVDVETFEEADTCHNTTPTGPTTAALFAPISGTEVCPPSLVRSIPAPNLTEVVLCGGALQQDTCAAQELCAGAIPDGFGETLCIAQEGEHECPASYPNARSVFDDVADSRGCTQCSCSAAGAFECSADLELFSDANCAGTATGAISGAGDCFDAPGSLRFSAPTVTGDCTPSSVAPIGSVVGDEPVTVCCQ